MGYLKSSMYARTITCIPRVHVQKIFILIIVCSVTFKRIVAKLIEMSRNRRFLVNHALQ